MSLKGSNLEDRVSGEEEDQVGEDDDEIMSNHEEKIIQARVPLHGDPEFSDPNQKNYKYGIIYLSYIPEGLTVKILREIMSQFGELGRMYLEPENNNKKHRTYIEGWIEFKKKRVAKSVAKSLNGKALQYGRKHCKMNGQIWSIKYLHKFKWAHLIEQLAHDRATREQKRVFEMSQAKKQVDFYQKMTERSKLFKRLRNKRGDSKQIDPSRAKSIQDKQNKPRPDGNELDVPVSADLLSNIFKKIS